MQESKNSSLEGQSSRSITISLETVIGGRPNDHGPFAICEERSDENPLDYDAPVGYMQRTRR